MITFNKKIVAVAISSILLTGCFSGDDDAVADAGTAVSLKERRSETLTSASGSGEGDVSVVWTQVTGPELTISGADTLTPQITAPSVDVDSSAVLRLTVTDSKGQVAEDEVTVSIINNTLPQLTEQPPAIAEKTAVELTPALADDGEIATVIWQQTAGPAVELSADSGATISFTAPAVTEATTLSFALGVADDDGEVADIALNVVVQPSLIALTLSGQVSGADFAGSTATLSGAAEPVTAEVDAAGAFNFDLQLDDDLLNNVVSVKLSAAENNRLTYSAVYSGFSQPEPAASNAVGPDTISQPFETTAAEGSNTVAVNAVSTALYSLLVSANNGTVPENIDQLVFVEKSVDADELTEAAAVVKILTENPDIALPEGVTDITELLTNVAAYNTVVENIETEQPGLIAETVVEIIEDPELTPPVTADAIAPVYYQTAAAAPGFLSRQGEQWLFNQNGTGSLNNQSGSAAFNWSVDEFGDITVAYTEGSIVNAVMGVAEGVGGLTAEQVSWLEADNIYQVPVEIKTPSAILNRIGTGQQIDSFNIERSTTTRVLPIQTSQGLVETTGVTVVSNANVLMRKQVSDQYAFSAADMPGEWAINSYAELELYNRTANGFYLDRLQFSEGGTGVGLDTGRTFSWQVDNGLLKVQFADNTKLEARIIDVSGSDYQLVTIAKDSADNVIAADSDYGFKVQADLQADWITGSTDYWQTMINEWRKFSWDNGRLLLCADDPQCEDPYAYIAAFGWQFLADGAGNQVTKAYGNDTLPPNFSPSLNSISWAADGEVGLSMTYGIFERNWTLLKMEDGVLGTRIYVKEEASMYDPDFGIDGVYIGSRIGMYEQIPVSYWNDSVPDSAATSVSFTTATAKPQQRKVVNPTRYNSDAR